MKLKSWDRMRAIGIIGSPHKNGNSAYLLEIVLKVLEEEFEIEKIFLKDLEIRACEGCYLCEKSGECVIEDDMQKIYPKLEKADVIILSTPSHMGGVASRLRTFMERTWPLRKGRLEGKIGSYVVVGRRRLGAAISEIEEYFSRLGLIKIPGVIGYAFKEGEIEKDKEAIDNAKKLGERILKMVNKKLKRD